MLGGAGAPSLHLRPWCQVVYLGHLAIDHDLSVLWGLQRPGGRKWLRCLSGSTCGCGSVDMHRLCSFVCFISQILGLGPAENQFLTFLQCGCVQCWAVPGAFSGRCSGRLGSLPCGSDFGVGFCHQRGQHSFGLGGDHVSVSMLWLVDDSCKCVTSQQKLLRTSENYV